MFFDQPRPPEEYEALIAGLRIAAQMRVCNARVSVDSKLVANQVLGTYVAKEENMVKYLEKTKSLISGFANFYKSQVPRSKNKKADALSKIASTSFAHLSKQVLVEVLKEKSIQEEEVATVVEEEGPTWMTPIMEYLKDETLLGDRKQQANSVSRLDSTSCWKEKGPVFDSHCGLFHKIDRGESRGNNHTDTQVKKFVWDNIVCRFGLSGEIVSDNGKQFNDNPFKNWCEKLNITQHFASVKHPQSNGLVERANRSLGEGIKARLDERNKDWIEELPHILWSHRTMIKSSHGDTPFSLTYGTKVVIPSEIGMPTVCGITFRAGDFVYRINEASHAMGGGKLGQKWEGPYEITEVLGDGAYMLRSMDGVVLPRTWNVANLKKCYL
nr:reverse transcriptase domain-containing protein [Tanacetum cinerariifolium]